MNTDDTKRLEELLQLWYENKLDKAGEEEFLRLLNRAGEQEALSGAMEQIWAQIQSEDLFSQEQKEAMFQKIVPQKKARILPLRRLVGVAAILLLAIGTSLYFIYQSGDNKELVNIPAAPQASAIDVQAPESNKAILTLSDGQQLVLDSAGNGALVTEGNLSVIKPENGQLVYSGNADAVKYHTLTVPKGSKPFRLTLPDGSKVQVNVASSITFPTAFTGAARKVKMTGEAYFEVAHLASPFEVEANEMQVEVLGTRFNVNAYEDEAVMKTTLLEGAVRLKSRGLQQLLAPNEQAVVANGSGPNSNIRLVKNADVEEAMAWVNNKFRFNNVGVEAVMRQVSRWYDVEVIYAAKPAMRFGGQIDRNSTLRQMLTILETSGLHFSINGKQVTILP